MAVTGWQLGSLDLRTLAHEIETTSGWDSFPGLKGGGVEHAWRHGEDNSGRRFYRPRDILLSMIILPTDASGSVTTSPEEHIQENIDTLMGALHSSTGYLTLTKTLPDTSTRTAQVRPMALTPIRNTRSVLIRSVILTLRMDYPFWHGASAQVSGSTSLAPNNLGNAPVNDMIITFTTAGRITHDTTGEYVESASAGLVLDVGTGIVTTGVTGDVSTNSPWFLQLEPGVNNLTLTGTATIDWNHGYF